MPAADRKDALRSRIIAQRAALSPDAWVDEDAARTRLLLDLIGQPTAASAAVALYASRPGEPSTDQAIETLHARGWRILLPKLARQPNWAWFDSTEAMAPSWGGIPEPSGAPLGAAAIALAAIIVVPCLAIGPGGTRLGTGGGWYDRALPLASPETPVFALARDSELLATIPCEPHDLPVSGVITPATVRRFDAP